MRSSAHRYGEPDTMSVDYHYTITNKTITVVHNGQVYNVAAGAPNFDVLRAALMKNDDSVVLANLTIRQSIDKWSDGEFKIVNGNLLCNGEELPEQLSVRVIAMVTRGDDPKHVLRFWKRLQNNPSWRSVQQLWSFLDNGGIPIDQDGYILAYKSVNHNWTDVHSGTVKNTIGAEPSMNRNKISDDPNLACHVGYHVGAIEYAKSFGPEDRRIIICRVDPADVVCIPYDCSAQKMRVCKYKVIGVHGVKMPSTVLDTSDDPVVKEATKPVQEPKATPVVEPVQEPTKPVQVPEMVFEFKPAVEPDQNEWEAIYGGMDFVQLMEQSTSDLRKYACFGLKIVGASKIPGGKLALVQCISEARGKK